MKVENIIEKRQNIDFVYELVNDLISNHGLELMDLAYPEHDGSQDANAVSEMMLLRQSANSLSSACQILVRKLTEAIGD